MYLKIYCLSNFEHNCECVYVAWQADSKIYMEVQTKLILLDIKPIIKL